MTEYNIMIDIETLSLKDNAVVLSIGAQRFNTDGSLFDEGVIIYPNVQEQVDKVRSVDYNTIKWWMNNSKEAINKTFVDTNKQTTLEESERLLSAYLNYYDSIIWANGLLFDINILKNLFPYVFSNVKYGNFRDYRTIVKMFPHLLTNDNDVAHSALDDCRYQIDKLHKSWTLICEGK